MSLKLVPRLLVAAALAAALGACSPGIHLKRYRPAYYNLGATRNVALLNVQGPPEATGVVSTELAQQILHDGFFNLYNQQPQPIAIIVMPGQTMVQNIEAVRAAVPAEVYISAYVTNWNYGENERWEETTENGVKVKRLYRIPHGSVGINFQVVQASTGRLVVMREFHGEADGDKYLAGHGYANPALVLRYACAHSVDHFLGSITPATVYEKIVLDDEEDALKPGIDLCKQGALDQAMATFENILQSNPSSSGAAYNTGVLFEAQGDYAKAEERYNKAHQLKPKKLYIEAIQQLHRRIAEEQALQQPLG